MQKTTQKIVLALTTLNIDIIVRTIPTFADTETDNNWRGETSYRDTAELTFDTINTKCKVLPAMADEFPDAPIHTIKFVKLF
jgi:hypothetical protein